MIHMTDCPGTRIKYLRQISSMSQEELGRRVGVQRAAINKYEKGTVENIPIKTIERIAKVFDVSPTYLVGWNDHDATPLAAETRVLKGVHHFYGKEAIDLLESFTELSPTGKKRLLTYAEELTLIYK
jgi:transcriptional regulator with XRE-family HTH domain